MNQPPKYFLPTEDWILGVVLVQSPTSLTVSYLASFVIHNINVAMGAHHLDLRPPNAADFQEVKDCRNLAVKTLSKWIGLGEEEEE